MKKLLAVILLIAMTLSVTPVFADEAPLQLALEKSSASLDSISLTFNKEIDFEVLKNGLVLTSDGNKINTDATSADNRTIEIKPEASLDLGSTYTLFSPVVLDSTHETLIKNFSFEINVVKLFSDSFDYSSNEEFTAAYGLRGSGGYLPLTSLPLEGSSYADRGTYIADVKDGKMLIHINPKGVNASYNNWFVVPNGLTETNFDNYILEYTVENANSAAMDMVIRQGNNFSDSCSLFYRTMASNNYLRFGSLAQYTGTAPLTDDATKVTIVVGSYNASNDLLEIYHNGVLKDRRTDKGKFTTAHGLFGFRCAALPSVDLIIDDIKAYKVNTSSSGTPFIPQKLTSVELSSSSFTNGSEITCNITGGDSSSDVAVSYSWYVGKNENEYPENDDDWEAVGTNENKFTIENENKYVKCVVSQSVNGIVTAKYESAALFKEVPPMAMHSEIVKKDDNTLTANYTYFDANRDLEKDTAIEWFTSADGKSWSSVKKATVSDGDQTKDVNFDVTGLTDLFVKCEIVPKSEKLDSGDKVELLYTLPFKPVASNVKITGNSSVGTILVASYDYYDENGDEENTDKTRRIWYRISGSKKTEVAKGLTYSISKADEGCKLIFEVTPKNDEYPENVTAYESNEISVKKSSSSSSSSSSSVKGSYSSKSEVSEDKNYENSFVYIPEPEPVALQDVVGHWAEKEIRELYEKELINGRGNGYEPESNITRAEWLTLLYRASGIDTKSVSYKKAFDDVSEDSWYAIVVSDAYTKKLIKGDNGKFNPDDSITREQMAKMLIDMLEYIKGEKFDEASEAEFSDNDEISEWAEEYINKAVANGLMNGTPENKFEPKKNATRAEAAAVLLRFINLIGQEG